VLVTRAGGARLTARRIIALLYLAGWALLTLGLAQLTGEIYVWALSAGIALLTLAGVYTVALIREARDAATRSDSDVR